MSSLFGLCRKISGTRKVLFPTRVFHHHEPLSRLTLVGQSIKVELLGAEGEGSVFVLGGKTGLQRGLGGSEKLYLLGYKSREERHEGNVGMRFVRSSGNGFFSVSYMVHLVPILSTFLFFAFP